MTKKYRKTVNVEAEQFDGSWRMAKKYSLVNSATSSEMFKPKFFVSTLEGRVQVHVGSWIATGVNGEHWPIADDIFQKTYAELPVIPTLVAEYIEKRKGKFSLFDAMYLALDSSGPLSEWVESNQDIFVYAWMDGYQLKEAE